MVADRLLAPFSACICKFVCVCVCCEWKHYQKSVCVKRGWGWVQYCFNEMVVTLLNHQHCTGRFVLDTKKLLIHIRK